MRGHAWATCSVEVVEASPQSSCELGKTFGCEPGYPPSLWTAGDCHGHFRIKTGAASKGASLRCNGRSCPKRREPQVWVHDASDAAESGMTGIAELPPPSRGCAIGGRGVLFARSACVLVASAAALSESHPIRLALGEVCHEHPWVRGILNFFDGPAPAKVQRLSTHLHPAIAVSSVPGFKTLFWKRIVTTKATRQYSHVFLIDSDMGVRPHEFQLVQFLRLAEATNVSIMGASPYGPQMLYANGTRCPGKVRACEELCFPNPTVRCPVCRQPVVEVKMPLFTATAWAVVHDRVLSTAADSSLVADTKLDLTWCDMVNHYVHGCDPRAGTNCIERVGAACAYSYSTPIWHYNAKAIHRFMQAGAQQSGPKRPVFHSATFVKHLQSIGMTKYEKMPTWRPPRTLLKTHACWSVDQLRKASPLLANFTGEAEGAWTEGEWGAAYDRQTVGGPGQASSGGRRAEAHERQGRACGHRRSNNIGDSAH